MNLGTEHIEEAEVIWEETVPLADRDWGEDEFIRWIGRQADRLSEGNRGLLVTNALILADYAKDNQQLRQAYRDGQPAIDRYFDQVDIERVITDHGSEVATSIKENIAGFIRNNIPGFIAGTMAAAGTIIAINKYRNHD